MDNNGNMIHLVVQPRDQPNRDQVIPIFLFPLPRSWSATWLDDMNLMTFIVIIYYNEVKNDKGHSLTY